jgi:hypothetical protein
MRHRDLERFALQLAPELGKQQLYILDHPARLPRPDVFGYTVANSPPLQKALERAGEWEGTGQYIVFADTTLTNEQRDVVLLHELAHRLPFSPSNYSDHTAARKFATFIESAEEPLPKHTPAFTVGDHGSEFTRIALHLWWRASMLGTVTWFDGLCAGPAYQLSPPLFYWRALGSEPIKMLNATFADIVNTPPPDDFTRLFRADIRRWINCHPEALKAYEQEQEPCQLS